MTVWIIAIVLSVAAVVVVLAPLLRQRSPGEDAAAYDIEVYKDQLNQVSQDYDRGLLTAEQAQAAKTEISRRILQADRQRGAAPKATPRVVNRGLAAFLAVAVPAAALGFYAYRGEPDLPGKPFAERAQEQQRVAAKNSAKSLEQSADILAKRLQKNPSDLNGWILLARTYMSIGRFQDSVGAFEKALKLDPNNANLRSAYGEALFMAADSIVTPASRAAFEETLKSEPDDPRAKFYLALAEEQAGNRKAALDKFAALLKASPADAPWVSATREHIRAAADALGVDVASVMPQPLAPESKKGREPTTAEMADIANMPPEQRQAMINQMVSGLAQRLKNDPSDFAGWQRLIRAYAVQGKKDKALEALATARKQFAAGPFAMQQLAALASELKLEKSQQADESLPGPTKEQVADAQKNMTAEERQTMIEGMVDQLAEKLKDKPDNFAGWVRLIRSYTVLGKKDKALEALATARKQFAAAPFPMQQLSQLAVELKLEKAPSATEAPRGPTQDQIADAQKNMSPEERQTMIKGMVAQLAARLKDNPNDIPGWIRLARSYNVLRQPEKARDALADALKVAPDNVQLLILYGRTLRATNGDRPTKESVAAMRKVLKLSPDNMEALWFVGAAEAAAGNKAVARTLWEKVLSKLPAGSQERVQVRQRIDSLN